MIFIIPFAFAYNPLILTVAQSGAVFTWGAWLLLLAKLALAIVVLASALARHDRVSLGWPQVLLRVVAAVLMFAPGAYTDVAGIVLALGLLALHRKAASPAR